MSNSDNRNALPARKDIDAKYKWRLEDLFADDSQWEALFTATSRQTKAARKYKGKLRGGDGKQLLAALKLRDRVSQDVEQLYVYARMRRDEDNANGVYQTLSARAEALMTDLMTEWAFFEPEVLGFAEELETMYRKTPELTAYRFLLDELLRQKEHVLSPAEEQLLAGAADALRTGHTVFTMFNNADLRFPSILDEDGARVQLSHGRYGTFLESADRNVRRRAFKALYAEYGKYRNTLASCYSGNVKTDVFYARARKYPDSLTASLDKDKVPVSVYDNLVESVHAGIGTLNRYLRMRKEMLGLARLHMYDLYVPLVQLPKKTYTFEEGRDIVLRALKPLGEDYVKDAEAAFRDGWIDVYENQGKTSGAYSWGCYTGHPYVLLNWQGRLDDIFTLTHELGHAMHSFYSNRSQPYHYAGYTIFVAEVASTVNENLLLHALLDT